MGKRFDNGTSKIWVTRDNDLYLVSLVRSGRLVAQWCCLLPVGIQGRVERAIDIATS